MDQELVEENLSLKAKLVERQERISELEEALSLALNSVSKNAQLIISKAQEIKKLKKPKSNEYKDPPLNYFRKLSYDLSFLGQWIYEVHTSKDFFKKVIKNIEKEVTPYELGILRKLSPENGVNQITYEGIRFVLREGMSKSFHVEIYNLET